MADVQRMLEVDFKTGRCYWKVAPRFHPQLLGTEAGSPRTGRDGKKYWVVKVCGIPLWRSHIVFATVYGYWPFHIVDHRNGDSLDDRSINLRQATIAQNNQNRSKQKKSSDLPMGVRAIHGRFNARCQQKSLGMFDSSGDAHEAYLAARAQRFGEFA
jgi:hypothetical protein